MKRSSENRSVGRGNGSFPSSSEYHHLIGQSFLFPSSSLYSSEEPEMASRLTGFELKGEKVYSLLMTDNLFLMKETPAGAILASFRYFPSDRTLSEMFRLIRKPVFVSVWGGFLNPSRMISFSQKLETYGGSLYLNHWFSFKAAEAIAKRSNVAMVVEKDPDVEAMRIACSLGIAALSVPVRVVNAAVFDALDTLPYKLQILARITEPDVVSRVHVSSEVAALIYKPHFPHDTY